MMATTTIETRHSICDRCRLPIRISITAGQRWHDVEWQHVDEARARRHRAVSELRFAIDATWPGCEYPEIGFAPASGQFICSRCGHTQTKRPKD